MLKREVTEAEHLSYLLNIMKVNYSTLTTSRLTKCKLLKKKLHLNSKIAAKDCKVRKLNQRSIFFLSFRDLARESQYHCNTLAPHLESPRSCSNSGRRTTSYLSTFDKLQTSLQESILVLWLGQLIWAMTLSRPLLLYLTRLNSLQITSQSLHGSLAISLTSRGECWICLVMISGNCRAL